MILQKFSNAAIGAITGLLMIASGFILYKLDVKETSPLQYLGYGIYGLGIVYVVSRFARQNSEQTTFGSLFNQGFKCFIIATLLMTIYTFLFYKFQPKLLDEIAERTKTELIQTDKNRTAQEITTMVDEGKGRLPLFAVYGTVFQYLLIGSIVTLAASGAQILNKKN